MKSSGYLVDLSGKNNEVYGYIPRDKFPDDHLPDKSPQK
jgi:hypothetical protein